MALTGVKAFTLSFILSSLLFSLLYLPTYLRTTPLPIFRPTKPFIAPKSGDPYPATFAYLISASKGDAQKLKRLLLALYHPGNHYLIHVDFAAPKSEHAEITKFVSGNPTFRRVGNVWIAGKPNLVTYRGPTMVATTLQAMSLLLRICRWDWFINLSASDYPLVTQDDLIDAFSGLPKDLNFIQHSSRLGWKLNKRAKPIIMDPALHSGNKSDIWWAVKQRTLPTAFKLYTGIQIQARRWIWYFRPTFANKAPAQGWIEPRSNTNIRVQPGQSCPDHLPSTALWAGTTCPELSSSTTPTSSPRRRATSRRWHATLPTSGTPPSTTTSTTSLGTRPPSSIPAPSASRTTGKWSSATAPSHASSGRTTPPSLRSIGSFSRGARDNSRTEDGVPSPTMGLMAAYVLVGARA
ncbi:beta-glucuronosyltransferase GlcAT14A-like isoform X2 [Diospyros lotus]|uniref:beta-glucuronosyltransferase GlcAT14A-like isoform X2 n=1 Tax=Diospyros lotus TaxID=55363 RepID=UPI00225B605C|nr:beta-glucuronosyltransferase GlcAT14A-like isoform X2 [Diospyros lotus]